MASDMIEGELNVLTMSNDQIVNLISPTHLPAEEKFDASSLFVVVRNILKRVTHDLLTMFYWYVCFYYHIIYTIFFFHFFLFF
jgi:hypothetical protein